MSINIKIIPYELYRNFYTSTIYYMNLNYYFIRQK